MPVPNRATLIGGVAVAAVVAVVLTLLIGPRPPEPLRRVSGDAALAGRLSDALAGGDGIRTATVALIEDGGATVTYAGLDRPGGSADEHTRFEIGSVTKALTGMLLADAAERGEVRLDTAAGSVVPGLGKATLTELAGHHSGLPRLPTGPSYVARAVVSEWAARNPYSSTPEEVLAEARSAGAPGGGDFGYSNLRAATLGQVLARAIGAPYERLLSERVLQPLGMAETTVVTRSADLPVDRAVGVQKNGRRQAPWISAGYAPAGIGVWSTAADLARLVQALLRSEAPGGSATRPLVDAGGDDRIGLGWFTRGPGAPGADDPAVAWHNGGTGGFRSFVGFDAAAGRGIVLLAATSRDVDDAARALLAERSD